MKPKDISLNEKLNNGYKFVVVIKNIKNPDIVLSGGIKNKYKGAYKKIFDILNKDSIFVEFESDKEELIGNDFYLYFSTIPDADKLKLMSKISNVEILEKSFENGGLLAPNGKVSNLNAKQYELVRTPAFKKWFGDWENNPENASKVVDENGEPLVVYHGTYVENPFYIFDFDKADLGFHFGTYEQAKNRSETKLFFKGRKSIVNSFFLNIKTIFESTDIGEWEYPQRYIDMFVSDGLISESDAKKNGFYRSVQREENKQIREYLLNKYGKFCGFVYNNKYEGKGKSFIVLNPTQIKLAEGTNTTFDSNNNDVRYYYGGNTLKKDNMKKTVINWSEYYKVGGEIPKDIKSKIYDSNGDRRIDKNAIQALTDYAENLPQTKDANLDRNGDYTASRKKLHQRIINSFKDELVCIQKKEPIAILMGGSPASGKSTFLRKYAPYLLKEEILKVDADEIRAMLPEYKGWNATSTHLETKDIVNTLLSDKTIGIPCKYDVIYDGTMNSTKSYIPLMKLLKELGYKIFIVYIDKVPEEVVKKRALERYKKSGRFVPEAVIDDFFSRGKSALNELKEKADGYMIIDGSDGEYNILEQSGMRLPKRRLYSQLGQPIKKIAKN